VEGKVKALPGDGQRFGVVETSTGALKCVLPDDVALQDSVIVVVRPEDINLVTQPRSDQNNLLRCKVEAVVFMGEALECQAVVGAQKLRTKLHPSSAVRQGEIVALELPPERCRALRG
jgi:iron(III) transport system ATP-binding protein